MVIDPSIVVAILAALPVAGAFQLLKATLKTSGAADYLIGVLVSFGCTAIYYLFIAPPILLVNVLIYGALVSGEVLGIFKLTIVAQQRALKKGRKF